MSRPAMTALVLYALAALAACENEQHLCASEHDEHDAGTRRAVDIDGNPIVVRLPGGGTPLEGSPIDSSECKR